MEVKDVFGIEALAKAVDRSVEGVIGGAEAVLSRLVLPAAEEVGLALRDKVGRWRAENAAKATLRAQELLEKREDKEPVHAHPRMVGEFIEGASWNDDALLQQMWGGLLAASCTRDGQDQSNLIFANLLKQMTPPEVRLLDYVVEHSYKSRAAYGLIHCDLLANEADLLQASGESDVHRLDLWLDHMREIGVLVVDAGFHPARLGVRCPPSALGITLYVRAQGYAGTAVDYFDIKLGPAPAREGN